MATANENFLDALVRHQVFLLRLSGSLSRRTNKLLDATEEDMASEIRRRMRLARGGATPRNLLRLSLLERFIKATRLTAWSAATDMWFEELLELTKQEPAFVSGALRTVSPVTINTVLPAAGLLRSIVITRPFQGRTLRQWARKVRTADIERINNQIRIGLVQGETADQMARRVVGTARLRAGGVTEIARRDAKSITLTAVNAFSNAARRQFFQDNVRLFSEELYVATLDGNTTPICRSLDGRRFSVGVGPIPPLHFRCRSLRVAVIDDEVIGRRPTKASTQRGLLREFTGERGLQSVTNRGALPRGTRGAFDKFSRTRVRELTGQVPARTTYQEWLGRQSAMFQDDVLGRTRGRLFRRGDLPLDRFVDATGREIPLSELARSDRAAFTAAGLDPDDF